MSDNVNESLRSKYFTTSEKYAKLYQKYLDQKFSSNADEQKESLSTYNELKVIDQSLRDIMDKLKKSTDSISNKILESSDAIERKTFQIYEKAKTLDIQQDLISRKNEELHSKKKQIEMGIQKNKYRRNLIFVLIALNIILIISLYFFYVKA
jgi:uncharacterized membrane protein